ncbi:MAG TPA: hypothetical protein VE826_06755 [Dongiaceae bacterium]|nr:hypothetical protein [Dongiaceae bacterium]
MQAHWPGIADRGSDYVQDLACIAALYGLAPRGATPIPVADEAACPPLATDETVEQFREHLERYVRTFLEGTTTVQGILRIVAEALALHIADAYADLDTWWARAADGLSATEPRGDGAAEAIFGTRAPSVRGVAPSAARVAGRVDLRSGADLRDAAHLVLSVDGAAPVDVDLSAHANASPATFGADVAAAIRGAVPALDARIERGRLVLESRTTGPASALEVLAADGDAAPALLGLPRRHYRGSAATGASVTGTVALDGGIDFSAPGAPRYLRLRIDGTRSFEIDCAGAPAPKTLAEITSAINAQAGFALASNDGHVLTVTSPTVGFGSSIAFEPAAAEDATAALFGAPPLFTAGRDAQPARAAGIKDNAAGVDLSAGSTIQVSIDGDPLVTIDCAGAVPAATRLNEVVDAINAKLATAAAVQDGHVVTLSSRTAGPSSTIAVLPSPPGDATAAIFGIVPRQFGGGPARPARLAGTRDLAPAVEVGGTHLLEICLDGAPARTVDLHSAEHFDRKKKSRLAAPQDVCNAINAVFGTTVATTDGQRIVLTSPTLGAASAIAVLPDDVTRERRFVTRAFITDDAAPKLFGVPRGLAEGIAATAAVVTGTKDLSRGTDLTAAAALRIAVDGGPFVDVDCAAKSRRPRAALVTEVRDALAARLDAVLGAGAADVTTDGRVLTLRSGSAGARSAIAFGAGGSALGALFGGPVSAQGRDATGVVFVGTADLSAGADLSTADRLALAVDGGAPVEIACAGPDPAQTSLSQICARINLALGAAVAANDGKHVVLSSVLRGGASGLDIGVPAAADATNAILGISGARSYRGADAQPARAVGAALHEPLDLHALRFIGLSVDGRPPLDVSCAGAVPAATTLAEIVSAINAVVPNVAAHDGTHVILTSARSGSGARIDVVDSAKGDARAVLFGDAADAAGTAASAASITGTVDLLTPVNLAEHSTLALAVDGAEPFTVDVAGGAPDRTMLDEVVAKINAVVPGLASATADDRLQLTSPTSDDTSRVELRAVRALELIDYPPTPRDAEHELRYAETFRVRNDGATPATLELAFRAPHGVEGAELVDLRSGLRLRLATAIGAAETVNVRAAKPAGISAERLRSDGSTVAVAPSDVIAAPLGRHAFVPFGGRRELRSVHGERMLTLDDAFAAFSVQLHALNGGSEIAVRVTERNPPASLPPATARRFDVEIAYAPAAVPPVVESYAGVTIGAGPAGGTADSLAARVNHASVLARATEIDKAAVLRLPVGTSTFIYRDCDDARFDCARFDASPFAGGVCSEYGIFDASLFTATTPPRTMRTLFAAPPPSLGPPITVQVRWKRYAPGAFTVNLPADLPDEFGARFDRGRFATAGAAPDVYDGVVFDPDPHGADPPADPDNAENRIGTMNKPVSTLVTVKLVDRVPIGFEGFVMPFHQPRERYLALGSATAPARLYLTESGVAGFYELTATSNGTWGNAIAVTARKAGPARFDVTIGFDGARFENGRVTALAGGIIGPGDDPLPALAAQILKPRPVGVLQAKAAGIQAAVSRDRAEPVSAL